MSTTSPLHAQEIRALPKRSPRHAVLAYHELSQEAPAYQYTLNCRQFEDHLQLASRLQLQSSSGESPVAISFDDGHISNYAWALPLLEKYSCKAIFFVIAGRIGERRDFMTWGHLKDLVSLGHRVEAHGWSHVFLTTCSQSELQTELRRSKDTIEERLNTPVQALSAPHGRWDARVLRACGETGYRELYTSNPWDEHGSHRDVQVRGRLVAVQSLNAHRLLHWMTMGTAEAAAHRAKQGLKNSARQLMGDKLYYKLWSRFSGWTGPQDYSSES